MGICNSKDSSTSAAGKNSAVVKKSNKQASATVPQSNSEDNMVSLRGGCCAKAETKLILLGRGRG